MYPQSDGANKITGRWVWVWVGEGVLGWGLGLGLGWGWGPGSVCMSEIGQSYVAYLVIHFIVHYTRQPIKQ